MGDGRFAGISGRVVSCLAVLAALAAHPVGAQKVSGVLFEDRDADGVFDPGEPLLPGVRVDLAGRQADGTPFASSVVSGTDGLFSFAPGDGAYLLAPIDPPGWRLGPTRADGFATSTPGYALPVGRPRFSALAQGIGNLSDGAYRMTVLGDSIAANFALCSVGGSFRYSQEVLDRLGQTVAGATLSLDQEAFLGSHTDDLHDPTSGNYVRGILAFDPPPDLVTISLIGNDLLGVEPDGPPTQQDINRLAEELQDARRNLQEGLAALTSEFPGADVILNTLYDNEADECATTSLHREWVPILDRVLRDLAWGQMRRVSINEVAAEFAHEDQLGSCTGFPGLICPGFLGLDGIHPNNTGYDVVREKLWESAGGVLLGPGDAQNRASIEGIEHGYLRRVARLLPHAWEVRGGAAVANPEAALSDQDGGAAAEITLGAASEEFRLAGFDDWRDEIAIVKVIAGVRYRTTGTVGDDAYQMEASIGGQFRPAPGFDYAPTDWNFYTPLVGAGGPDRPEPGDFPAAQPLVLPDVPSYREVSATLTGNPVLPAGAADYAWPPLTHADLATTTIRVASAPISATPGNDAYRIHLDHAWLDLYGWEKARPAEVQGLEVDRLADGRLAVSFDALPGAARYNLYFGRLSAMRGGEYDHGAAAPAGPSCAPAVNDLGGGRLEIVVPAVEQPPADAYVLVTAHVDDVESPSGFDSQANEIDRSQSICR